MEIYEGLMAARAIAQLILELGKKGIVITAENIDAQIAVLEKEVEADNEEIGVE